MTPRLPLVLSTLDLPLAELTAARLDGELFAVDSTYCPIDEIEQPVHRARALGVGLHERLIAEQLSAAWVWGALADPPAQHQFSAWIGSRVTRSNVPWRTIREVVVDESELEAVGTLLVTAPLRTSVDILRFSTDFDDREARAVAELMRIGEFDPADCVRRMNLKRNLPNKRRALARLAGISQTRRDQPELTR